MIMIYFIFLQCMKYTAQITQQRWKYSLTTICNKFMQQMTSSVSYGNNDFVSSININYCSLSSY